MATDGDTTARMGRICGVRENLVIIESDMPVARNEVVHVLHGERALQGEVLRVRGNRADVQLFEDTRGLRGGDPVRLAGELLSATLGPGLLGRLYDGLQQPLSVVAAGHGFLLPRGVSYPALDPERKWLFRPGVAPGDWLQPGEPVGSVQEGRINHLIMQRLAGREAAEVCWVATGPVTCRDPVARLRLADGSDAEVHLEQRWPVRRPLGETLCDRGFASRQPPTAPLLTGLRIVDTLFPIAQGGTACIPGPFGAGKTVLQNLLAMYADVDVVVMIACGERAGEVVETLTKFPELRDPRTGGALLDRTVIICNTSAMPVAARESSIYFGLTIGEYYRQMGLRVLVIADSTSRWAQAMRETSGRMEEIPGDEAYPAYLDSAIRAVYERAGVIQSGPERAGSLTMVGTVSPAGGNFDEPVTQSTLASVRVFLALSADRAYRRAFPAIEPLQSWSRYAGPLAPSFAASCGEDWISLVRRVQELLREGDAIQQMIEVAGEEGVSLEEYRNWQSAKLLDEVFLQQDTADRVDVHVPLQRMAALLRLVLGLVDGAEPLQDRVGMREQHARWTATLRQLNYSEFDSADYRRHVAALRSGPAPAVQAALRNGS